MIITIYGEDTFRSREFLHSTINQFKQKRDPSGVNIHRIDATVTPLAELQRQESSESLFGSHKRLFVVEQIEECKVEADELKQFIEARKSPEGNVVCFYVRGKLMGASGKALGTATYVYPFSFLTGTDLVRWIRDRAAVYGSEPTSDVSRLLMERFAPDLWAIDRELASLSALTRGGSITVRDYREREVVSSEYSSFSLAEHILAGHWRAALASVSQIPKHDWIPFVMLLASHVRGLVWLKERSSRGGRSRPASAESLPLNPYFLKKLSAFESRLTTRELVELTTSLVDIDTRMKTIPVDPSALALRGLLH